MDFGKDVNEWGWSPLHHAAAEGDSVSCRVLAVRGAKVDRTTNSGDTPLSIAARFGNTDVCVALLVALGADPNVRDKHGETPLHKAAFEGHARACEALLDAGADFRARDRFGKTPLFTAAQVGCLECCVVLVRAGSDADVRTDDGKSAVATALSHEMKMGGIFELLTLRGAVVEESDWERWLRPIAAASSTLRRERMTEMFAWNRSIHDPARTSGPGTKHSSLH